MDTDLLLNTADITNEQSTSRSEHLQSDNDPIIPSASYGSIHERSSHGSDESENDKHLGYYIKKILIKNQLNFVCKSFWIFVTKHRVVPDLNQLQPILCTKEVFYRNSGANDSKS